MVEDAASQRTAPTPCPSSRTSSPAASRAGCLSYMREHLLAGWQKLLVDARYSVRLRVLLCHRAFEAAFEVSNLLNAGARPCSAMC